MKRVDPTRNMARCEKRPLGGLYMAVSSQYYQVDNTEPTPYFWQRGKLSLQDSKEYGCDERIEIELICDLSKAHQGDCSRVVNESRPCKEHRNALSCAKCPAFKFNPPASYGLSNHC
jgi:hypothetical protein